MEIAAILGTLCLTGLRLLRIDRFNDRGTLVCLLACFTGVLVGAFCIHMVILSLPVMQHSGLAGLIKYQTERIKGYGGDLPENIIIIEGGSHAARAVNFRVIENQLKDRGYSSLVLQFAVTGANHFERLWLLTLFSEILPEESWHDLSRRNVVLLREASLIYDNSPIEQFQYNLYRDRTIAYLEPWNAILAAYAVVLHSTTQDSQIPWGNMKELFLHGLLSGLNIGVVHRLDWYHHIDLLKPIYMLKKQETSFKFDGLHPIWEEIKEKPEIKPLNLSWKEKTVDVRIKTIIKCPVSLAFFSVPVTRNGYANYLARYKKSYPDAFVIPYSNDMDFLTRLDDSTCWYDISHLLKKGALLYSNWLADELVESGLLEK